MIVHTIKVSEEVHDFEDHYWVGMEASITPEEDAVEQTKELRKKLEMVYSSDIKVEKIEKPNITPEETILDDKAQEEWKHLVKILTALKYREVALEYLANSVEWKVSPEAKQIANSLPSKNIK